MFLEREKHAKKLFQYSIQKVDIESTSAAGYLLPQSDFLKFILCLKIILKRHGAI
jgi:hypothetical protein